MKQLTVEQAADLGSISHATLRTGDLISAFITALEEIDPVRADEVKQEDSDIFDGLESGDYEGWDMPEDAHWVLEDLFDILNDYAPGGHYFGAHPGDGSDFGFWQGEEWQ